MNVGATAPTFELSDQQGANVSLADLLADGPVVLYFYIKAKTPG